MFLTLTVSPQIHQEAVHKMWRQIAIWCTDANCQNKTWLNKLQIFMNTLIFLGVIGSVFRKRVSEGHKASFDSWEYKIAQQCLCPVQKGTSERQEIPQWNMGHVGHGWYPVQNLGSSCISCGLASLESTLQLEPWELAISWYFYKSLHDVSNVTRWWRATSDILVIFN